MTSGDSATEAATSAAFGKSTCRPAAPFSTSEKFLHVRMRGSAAHSSATDTPGNSAMRRVTLLALSSGSTRKRSTCFRTACSTGTPGRRHRSRCILDSRNSTSQSPSQPSTSRPACAGCRPCCSQKASRAMARISRRVSLTSTTGSSTSPLRLTPLTPINLSMAAGEALASRSRAQVMSSTAPVSGKPWLAWKHLTASSVPSENWRW
mmetsp:Transcript_65364/g.206545  ORF Transcript_65364/g.206545 Transcript_65364/m.206545 type:complete len:207 (-) Transcript_65364:221-841(-)